MTSQFPGESSCFLVADRAERVNGNTDKTIQTNFTLNVITTKKDINESSQLNFPIPSSPFSRTNKAAAAERRPGKWISKHGNVAPLLHCLFFLYLLLICIDLSPAPQFC